MALLEVSEQSRSFKTTNDVSYTFDGMGWYLDDGTGKQLVFAVQWRPGEIAVFGNYQQAAKSKARQAYFLFDETSGEMIGGFETVGGALGALLPSDASQFQPFLYTPELDTLPTQPVAIQKAILHRNALPEGPYLITVTGFNIGDQTGSGRLFIAVLNK